MISRSLLSVLLLGLLALLIAFAVLMGAFVLLDALGDAAGARVLWWVAFGCLLLLMMNLVMLLVALAVRVLEQWPVRSEGAPERSRLD